MMDLQYTASILAASKNIVEKLSGHLQALSYIQVSQKKIGTENRETLMNK